MWIVMVRLSVVLTGHDCFPDNYKYEAPEQQFMEEFHQNMTTALKPYMSGERE
jgi:hypothetical protein